MVSVDLRAVTEEGDDFQRADEPVKATEDLNIWKLAAYCNIIQISYALMAMFGKDALVNQNVGILDFALLRSILMLVVS
jgi:hypothetical protein